VLSHQVDCAAGGGGGGGGGAAFVAASSAALSGIDLKWGLRRVIDALTLLMHCKAVILTMAQMTVIMTMNMTKQQQKETVTEWAA